MPKSQYLAAAFILALLLLAIGFSLYYIHLADLDKLIILHYQALQGADILGRKQDVLAMLFSGLGIVVLNFLLASAFFSRRFYLTQLLAATTVLMALLILMAIIAIISVN